MRNVWKRTNMCGSLRLSDAGAEVVLNGWVSKKRNLGGLIFCDLRDRTGIVQIVFSDEVPKELFEAADTLKSEYVIGVRGTVIERESKNKELATGDIEIAVSDFVIYSASETPPIYIRDDDNVDENLRLKYRYLDPEKAENAEKSQSQTPGDHLREKFLRQRRFYRSGDADAGQSDAGRRERLSHSQPCQQRQILRASSVSAAV